MHTDNSTNLTNRRLPIALAAIVSVVAAVAALIAHTVFGVGEAPLVIGTLVIASVIGWMNAEHSARQVRPIGVERRAVSDFSHAA